MPEVCLRLPVLIIALTIGSGIFDSLAFTYSANIWQGGTLLWGQVAKAASAFAVGIILYWISIRYLREAGLAHPEIQTLIWFSVTIIGVAALGGRFISWPFPDQLAGLFALGSLGWLIIRVSE